ncbi:39S ribosomal protein L21, mitochondrial [Diorhabda carinulata]|uniref:39S ribosomal protein L21, mitochondrial n=1 Tax=Diorhabda sublineata TaxID=1163346 RepID=UPI0024E0DF7C|nr:39S ribosomal protein L21, mitochondrial [Diorhabda sublineata]XP_057660249.1 39S ribosomal protein L21, mitochondrial [Diorhabda carinulata]
MAHFLKRVCSQVYRCSQLNISNVLYKNTPFLSLVSSTQHYSNTTTPFEIVNSAVEENNNKKIIDKVNSLVTNKAHGRLFAVVHVAGKQFKVTDGDVIVIEGYWPPDVGDKITLDKVLLAGSADFTLIGTPIIEQGLVRVEATVIEKTLSHTKTHFRKKRRKQYMRIHFYRIPQTYLRIKEISIQDEINNPKDVRGLETAIF